MDGSVPGMWRLMYAKIKLSAQTKRELEESLVTSILAVQFGFTELLIMY